ncbi:hypothetical protein [Natrarchaeobius chitinivorans]|uniref:Uncharacterized protein n=1 Tax=Natrarchaeobius chitinivorans TaxID=1679083 RepID=A0A3N6PEI3_NATCH|nr:hypothetical protein [Natrarchaeobius chitinivorans]RQG95765.1 hypothetical protein EA473_06130 [Natrarchaeobius chitinivorans]
MSQETPEFSEFRSPVELEQEKIQSRPITEDMKDLNETEPGDEVKVFLEDGTEKEITIKRQTHEFGGLHNSKLVAEDLFEVVETKDREELLLCDIESHEQKRVEGVKTE